MSDGKKLIAATLIAGSVETLRLATEDLFVDDELVLYRFVKNHFRRYGEFPVIQTVEAETGQRLPQAPENVDYYLARLYDRKLYVALREQFGPLRDALQAFNVEGAREIVDRMKAACRVATPDNDVRNIREAAELVLQDYQEAHNSPGLSGIPCGLPTIDEDTGGYQRGDLVSWIGRMKMGKTYILLVQAIHAWRMGYSVLFVSMEMPIVQIARRVVAMEAGINPDYIRKGTLDVYGSRRMQRYVDSIVRSDRFNVFAGSFSKKVSDTEILMHELTPDIAFIDSAYRMQPDGVSKSANRIERVALTFDQLKLMTVTTNRPVVTSSQFSRGAGKKGRDGNLESVAFSDAIAMHSSLMYAIKEGPPPYETTRREIETMAGREGENTSCIINYRFDPPDFSEVQPEQVRAEAVDLDWMAN